MAVSRMVFITGSDAGYIEYIPGKGFVHVGGWGIEQLSEVVGAVQVLAASSRFKTQGLGEQIAKPVFEFASKELGAHLKDAGTAGGTTVVVVTAR